ncbi:MAG: 50S ribosomal protein L7/L12 [Patescibacteria group bacterium]
MDEHNKEESIEIPEKFRGIVETISQMSVLDLSELVKILEKKFGVSAAMPVMAPTAVGATAAGESESEAPSTVNINLTSAGGQKIQVIKVLREALGVGLKEAKDFADAAPKVIKEGIAREEAEELKKKLEAAGATVELK